MTTTPRELALQQLRLLCEPDVNPVLGNEELEQILDINLRVSSFAASTVFKAGDIVYPTTPNGFKYRVIRSGTTGTEPTWPMDDGVVLSGNVTFEFSGNELPSTYDLKAAAQAAWRKKAAKASKLMKTGGMDMSIIYKNCLDMVSEYDTPLIGG